MNSDLLKIGEEYYRKDDLAYEEDMPIKMSPQEKKIFLEGADVPDEQASNPWSINVEPTEEYKDYKKAHPVENVPILNKQLHDSGCASSFEYSNTLANLSSIIADIVAGDEKARDRPEFTALNFPAIKAAIDWLIRTNQMTNTGKIDLLQNAWMLNFKVRPPTPTEFISEKYIGDQANSLYPWAKDIFADYFDPLKPYRTLILTQCIGSGKSTFSTLAQLYISIHYALMWHPYKFFGLAPSSIFTQCMGGWNQKKASELLLEPFVNILECSPYFKRVRTHQDLTEASAAEIAEHLHWTTSAQTSALSFQNGVNYKIISNAGSILGQNIISAVISEMTMFEENGWSAAKIFNFFTKLRKRIDSRMKGNYYGRSQPLDCNVLMSDGSYKQIRDVVPGDKVKTPNEGIQTVISKTKPKKQACYEIEFDDGRKTRCSPDHLWKVSYRSDKNGNKIWEVVTLDFILTHNEFTFEFYDN